MRVRILIVASAAIGLSMWVPAVAQHEGHQMPGMASPANANVGGCARNAKTVTAAIDQASARVEDARQSNDPARLRALVSDLQLELTQMKAQLADCVALSQNAPGAGTASHADMPGMDHLKMGAASGPAEPGQSKSTGVQTGALDIAFTLEPSPPRVGANRFEVTVKDTSGRPVADAAVSLAFYMPPMPSMNMPEMRNTVKLAPAGNGVYRGEGSIGMAGAWDVTITVTRGQQQLGSKNVKVTAR
jgi:nitrogen fixation protein FixH